MRIRAFLEKELRWSRRHAVALIVVLVAVPAVFAAASVAFQTVLPEDIPVGVVGQTAGVSTEQLSIVEGAVGLFSKPVRFDSMSQAVAALRHEQVYAVIEVPPNLATNETASVRILVDGSIVPFKEASKAITNVANARLSTNLPIDVRVTRQVLGPTHTLSEFLVPLLLFGTVVLFAFTFVPYNLATERPALDRVRTEASLEGLVLSKLLFFSILMAIPIGVFALAAAVLGYDVSVLAPLSVLGLLVTFVLSATVAMLVMFLTNFSTTGRFLNVLLLFGLFAFGGLIYPVGFFSPLRRSLARLIPHHYAMILVRSGMLKDQSVGPYLAWIVGLCGLTVFAGLGMALAIETYRRRAA